MPRPKPGTPEYEAMAKAALEAARQGKSAPTGPQPQNPPPPGESSAGSGGGFWAADKPRPQPGTPEYEALVREALNQQRKAREGG